MDNNDYHNFRRKNIEYFLPKLYNLSMIYKWSDIVKIEGNANKALASISKKKYKKVSHGVYVDDSEYASELEQLFVNYPRATLTMQSAFEYYDLSDYIPDKYYLVTPYNSHTIHNQKVSQSYMDEKMMQIGRERIKTDDGFIFIFNKERMLIELFRLRSKLPLAYFLEIVSSYRLLKANSEISLNLISDYCQQLKNGNRILKQIQEMI